MSRAFTSADVVQSAPGSGTATTTVTPTLSATQDGNGGVIIMGALATIGSPENWHFAGWGASVAYNSRLVAVMSRADLPAGETAWPFVVSDGTTLASWVWLAEEWTNLSYAPLASQSVGTGLTGSPSSLTAGPSDSFTADYVVGIAALMVGGSVGATSTFSTVTWSSGWTETDVVTVGTGQNPVTADIQLRVARRYGTLAETGPWSVTATFDGGTQTGKTSGLCMAVLRAESWDSDLA